MKAIPLGLRATLLLAAALSAISCERLPTTADQAAPSRPSFVVVPGGGSWTTKAPMPTARAELGVAAVNGILYAVGGSDYPAFPFLATVEAYDPTTNTWTTKAPMPAERDLLGVAAVNGILYAVGGQNGSAYLATVEAYDPATNTWTTKAPMPTARSALGVAALNGIVYAVGGCCSLGGVLATVEAYDPATNTWTTKAPMPTARDLLGVAAVNGILYAVGGFNGGSTFYATVEAYDPATNTWTTQAPMPAARSDLGVAAVNGINGILYAVGGADGTSIVATLEAYDPATNTWTTQAPMPTARADLGVDIINGTLYAVGGYTGTTFSAANEAFTALGPPATLTLSPLTATNTVGTQHCVTATVKDAAGNPVPGVTVRFSVTGSNSASGSGTTDANGQATFCYTGTVAGTDAISAYADANNNNVQDPGEPAGAATKAWLPGAPATLILTPPTATNTVGTQHCVTATVKDAAGNPVAGVTVRFSVTGSNSASGSGTTGANGQATFCYTGTVAGADAISAYADANNNNVQDPGEPTRAAAKLWLPGAPATLILTPPTATNTVGTQHCVTATVKDAGGTPLPGVTVRFTVIGSNSASGSGTTGANGQATFCYTGTVAGTDAISAYADANNNSVQDPGEPTGAAAKLWLPAAPATLILTPPTATNTVGMTHCVTATVRDAFLSPVSGVRVYFSVGPSVPNTFPSPSSGNSTTNASGLAAFCYTASLPGVDRIHAFADANGNGTQDLTEPFGDAEETWTPPASTQLCEVTITDGGWIIANNNDRANFGGNAKVLADGTVQGQQRYGDQGPAQPMNVKATMITATTCSQDRTTASIYGKATIDGTGSHVFRIDVTDAGSGGSNDTYGITLDTGYMSGQHRLGGGNITIH